MAGFTCIRRRRFQWICGAITNLETFSGKKGSGSAMAKDFAKKVNNLNFLGKLYTKKADQPR